MYYDNEYTEQDAQRDMDACEKANGEHLADWAWTDSERKASERYLMIGGVFSDDAGVIRGESDLEQARRLVGDLVVFGEAA